MDKVKTYKFSELPKDIQEEKIQQYREYRQDYEDYWVIIEADIIRRYEEDYGILIEDLVFIDDCGISIGLKSVVLDYDKFFKKVEYKVDKSIFTGEEDWDKIDITTNYYIKRDNYQTFIKVSDYSNIEYPRHYGEGSIDKLVAELGEDTFLEFEADMEDILENIKYNITKDIRASIDYYESDEYIIDYLECYEYDMEYEEK